MTTPCVQEDSINEIKQDVKDIKKMLQDHLVESASTKKDVELHSKLWAGLIGIFISISVFFTQRLITKG